MAYDYYKAVRSDIEDALSECDYVFAANIFNGEIQFEFLYNRLNDELYDWVTGSANGSYTCNTIKAEENLFRNWDLMMEATQAFGYEFPKSPEDADVTIRCYLFDRVFREVFDELEDSVLLGKDVPEWLQSIIDKSRTEEGDDE